MRRITLRAGIAVTALLGLAGCSGDPGTRVANQPPIAKITGGPLEGSTASYTAEFFWTGWDKDGTIDHFEYALDPPVEFTLDEIMDPEHSNLTRTFIPGLTTQTDTMVVSKEVDGDVVSYKWIGTLEFSQSFVFETPIADSAFNSGTGNKEPRPTFSGAHTVYIRAKDNEGMYSLYRETGEGEIPPYRLGFNARTITPTSTVDSPKIDASDLLNVGTTMTVRWSGSDEDSPDPQGKPVGYLYKVLNLTKLGFNPAGDIDPSVLYLYTNEGDPGWVYLDADTSEHTFRLPLNNGYMFGLRAVDVAGGVEPFLELHRNVFKFRTVPLAGFPVLTINEASVGNFVVTYPFQPVPESGPPLQAAVGRPVRFFWNASAAEYGGDIDGYSWGVDIPDLDVEGPGSGWSAWGNIVSTPPLIFSTPVIHVFYIRARDTAGNINIAEIPVQFVPFPLDQEALYVDDIPDKVYPRPPEQDAFWTTLFDSSGGRFQPGEATQWDVYGANDDQQAPLSPDLARMGRYKMIIWSVDGGGYNGSTALLYVSTRTPRLGAYLRAGGKLWVTGGYSIPATSTPLVTGIGDFTYPKTGLGAGDFAWDFMKVQSGRVDNDKSVQSDERFVRAIPADSLIIGLPHIYNAMHVDEAKFSPRTPNKSVGYVDAVLDPMYAEADPGFRGDIDTLYVYGTQGRMKFGRRAHLDFTVCAMRWHDDDPAREHGRIQWFAFPMYYFKNDQAQDTFNKTIDWFREETPAVP